MLVFKVWRVFQDEVSVVSGPSGPLEQTTRMGAGRSDTTDRHSRPGAARPASGGADAAW